MSPYCFKCKKHFYPLGICRHRAMHRDKKESVMIEYADGTYIHNYGDEDERKNS